MPEPFERVEAGDLITAAYFNDLVDRLNDLHARVEDLEQEQGGIVINGFDPPTEVEVGQPLSIFGANFQYPPDQNTVSIDDRVVQEFLVGSTNTTLRLQVPEAIQVPQGGRNVTIRVSNEAGSAQRVYRLLPASENQPSITSVRRAGAQTDNLIIGQGAVITGENFGATAEENIVEFVATGPDGTQNVYPEDQSDLTFNTVSETRVEVVVPEIEEVPELFGISVLLRLTVDGLMDTQSVNVRRR